MAIKVLLADDIKSFNEHFLKMLENNVDIEVVGTAESGAEAVVLAKELSPDVILMDIQMETNTAGIDATEKILSEQPKIKIIVFTIHDDNENIIDAYNAGATDYLLKTASPSEVVNAIHDAMDYDASRTKVKRIVKDEMLKLRNERESFMYCVSLISRLSTGELATLKLLCDGKKYREIADERFVSESTVRVTINRITKKLSIGNIRTFINQMNELGLTKLLNNIFK